MLLQVSYYATCIYYISVQRCAISFWHLNEHCFLSASEHASSLEISWQGQKLGLKNTHEHMGIWPCLVTNVTRNMLNLGIMLLNELHSGYPNS